MTRFCGHAALLSVALLVPASYAQDAASEPTGFADELIQLKSESSVDDALNKSPQEFANAFNAHDAKAVAALWTPDGEYIDEVGQVFAGRAEIEKQYARFFQDYPQSAIAITVDSLRQISDTAAIEDGHATVAAGGLPSSTSKYTVVHVKVGDTWLMSSVRELKGEYSTQADPLAALRWLTGTWTAESDGSKMQVDYRWVSGNKYLQRTYSVTRGDHVVASGLQVIGFNPESQSIQSWTFSSDGGFAVGIWLPTESGWTIESRGTLLDGTSTQASNRFTRLDNNAVAWQSTSRSIGDVQLPDLPEYVLKRDSSEH